MDTHTDEDLSLKRKLLTIQSVRVRVTREDKWKIREKDDQTNGLSYEINNKQNKEGEEFILLEYKNELSADNRRRRT